MNPTSLSLQEAYNELSYYTLAHTDSSFIHQHIVDAFAAQSADEHTKPIRITFALIGLYLYIEKKYTGKQVQIAHTYMAKEKMVWPTFTLPKDRGNITVTDVLDTPAGEERDTLIQTWCSLVWRTYDESHEKIASLVRDAHLPQTFTK